MTWDMDLGQLTDGLYGLRLSTNMGLWACRASRADCVGALLARA